MRTRILLILFFLTNLGPRPLCAEILSKNPKNQKIISAALSQVGQTKYYDPAYTVLSYPGGDVPLERGVCTDVVIRAFRDVGIDLQKLVHEDMRKNFLAYPKQWGLKKTDTNIDHRRVPNLMTFFKRQKKEMKISEQGQDYWPGDIVAWRLSSGLLHIGLVSDKKSSDPLRFLIIHNIGQGTQVEDVLFAYEIIGHYRYF